MTDLIHKMPKYGVYKDSGVEWVGAIPKDWEILRLKNLAYVNPSLSAKDKKQNEIAIFLPMEKVSSDGEVDFSKKKSSHDLINGFTPFKKNDVIVAKITPCFENKKGACLNNMTTRLGFGSTEFHVLRKKTCSDSKFLYYLTKSHLFMSLGEKLMTGSAGQKRVPSEFMTTFPVGAPPLLEQTSIANFLDCKTVKIDQAIAIKEKQIQLLKERKQILIQIAVTKGLDPNVPMRDSGVEWIGEIPKNWIVKRAKYLFKEVDERSTTGKEELLSVSHMTGVTPRSEKNVNMFMAEDYTGSKTCQRNDIVFNIMWAWMGALGVTDRPGIVSSSYGIFRQQKDGRFNPNYLEFLLKTSKYIEHYNKVSTGLHSSRLRFYGHMFFNMEIGFPDRKEQDQIVTHIQTQSSKIDKAIAIQEQMIDKLKEYKATLINSAVTGKIKVPQTGEAKAVA